MTSKNKYIKTLDKFLDIMKSKSKPSFYENEKDQIAEDLITACKKADLYDELNQNPTLEQCIKEWEERGYVFKKRGLLVEIESKKWNVNIHIWMDDNELLISNYEENYYTIIPYDLIHLLSKTLKALEIENEK